MSDTTPNPANEPLNEEQKQYLAGFTVGAGLNSAGPTASGETSGDGTATAESEAESKPVGPEAIHFEAQDRFVADGKKLVKEEKAKREKNPLDLWDEIEHRAAAGEFPKGTDVFLTKSLGMFYVAPAQDAYMCRLRIPAGILDSRQFRGVADLANEHGGGYTHVTTRANLQIREIPPQSPPDVLMGLADLGILNRGSGADNIRNITASPTAGIDPQELIDTRPLARQMHHHILNHREMYNLPRKFNIAFDGGGTISALADTNDVGFAAVHLPEQSATESTPPGVYFRLQLGGITGHGDFARDVGWLLTPEQCVPVADAVVRVFIRNGDRTNRNKARLKYLLDDWGFEKFLQHVREELDFQPTELPLEQCEPRMPPIEGAHIGVHRQNEPGMHYLGVVLPVGRLSVEQMHSLADISDKFGSGTIRLTCWQNLLISDVHDDDIDAARQAIEDIGLTTKAHSVRAGLVACTGNGGCKFSASDTKGHALAVADHVESRIELDQPVNIHLTGCHHSCAQHFIGDIGMLGAKVELGGSDDGNADDDDDDEGEEVEGYHLYVGGGYGEHAGIGRELYPSVPADELPEVIERMLRAYLEHRQSPSERFRDFARRHAIDELRALFDHQAAGTEAR